MDIIRRLQGKTKKGEKRQTFALNEIIWIITLDLVFLKLFRWVFQIRTFTLVI